MSHYLDGDDQLRLAMLMLADMRPGCVCMDTTCPTGERVPHMANDLRNHPHPYGLISDTEHEWRRKPRWRRRR